MSFSFFIFLKKERKESKTPETFVLMLEGNKNNAKTIPKSSSIELIRAYRFVIFSMNFKHIVMTYYNPS